PWPRRLATNCILSSMTEHSFQGISPSLRQEGSVTFVSGTKCHLCLGLLRNQWVTAFPNPKESPGLGTNSLKEITQSAFQENFNFSSTYNESSIIRSAICSACIPAKFRRTSSLT